MLSSQEHRTFTRYLCLFKEPMSVIKKFIALCTYIQQQKHLENISYTIAIGHKFFYHFFIKKLDGTCMAVVSNRQGIFFNASTPKDFIFLLNEFIKTKVFIEFFTSSNGYALPFFIRCWKLIEAHQNIISVCTFFCLI